MGIKSYSDNYVAMVAENIGTMFKYAVENGIQPYIAWNSFISSNVAREIENGNPKYLSCSAYDYLSEVFSQDKNTLTNIEKIKDRYYWAGWILAFWEQKSGQSFYQINKYLPIEEVLNLYDTLHEADVTKFFDLAKDRYDSFDTISNLKIIRKASGLSQAQLAIEANVDIRSIQMYEQKRNDINKAQAETLYKLAKVLGCDIEDLLEK